MKGLTLGFDAGSPPGGAEVWRAVARVLRSPVSLARLVADDVVTTLFPADCRCCEGPLLRAHSVPVCDACLTGLEPSTLSACTRCGDAIDLDLDMEDIRFAGMLAEGLLCRVCRMASPPFARAVAYGVYDDELRSMIHLLKFGGVAGMSKALGAKLGEAVLTLRAVAASELLVVAVPLFRARERERGYNQSMLLADAALRWLKCAQPQWKLTAAHRVLRRVKRTESQYVLSPKGRRRNLRGAFAVAGSVQGREILLIDDILTSGATARECARVLLAAGASKVWVATVARAQKRRVRRQQAEPEEMVARWSLDRDAAVMQ